MVQVHVEFLRMSHYDFLSKTKTHHKTSLNYENDPSVKFVVATTKGFFLSVVRSGGNRKV